MDRVNPAYPTLDDWIAREAIPFALDAPEALGAAVDRMVAALDDSVVLLGFGEALHGAEELLVLRNRLFERLVEAHGYHAIAVESSLQQGRLVNEYLAGRGPASYAELAAAGFSHGFGQLDANRELVEWMRAYNADPAHPAALRFYGFDIPAGRLGVPGPRELLQRPLELLASLDPAAGAAHRGRIEPPLGAVADWENPAAFADHTQSPGLSPPATALRIATEDLITELRIRRPELVAGAGADQYADALHDAEAARQVLNYHAAHARGAGFGELLGIRDALMADNLAHIVAREQGRGKLLAFAHNTHLQRSKAVAWPAWSRALGSEGFSWWTAGAHIDRLLGPRYAVVGSALGSSAENGVAQPEAGTLEARLTATRAGARLIPTHRGRLPAAELAALPARSTGTTNLSYTALSAQSLADFDWLAVLDSATYTRGAPRSWLQSAPAAE